MQVLERSYSYEVRISTWDEVCKAWIQSVGLSQVKGKGGFAVHAPTLTDLEYHNDTQKPTYYVYIARVLVKTLNNHPIALLIS